MNFPRPAIALSAVSRLALAAFERRLLGESAAAILLRQSEPRCRTLRCALRLFEMVARHGLELEPDAEHRIERLCRCCAPSAQESPDVWHQPPGDPDSAACGRRPACHAPLGCSRCCCRSSTPSMRWSSATTTTVTRWTSTTFLTIENLHALAPGRASRWPIEALRRDAGGTRAPGAALSSRCCCTTSARAAEHDDHVQRQSEARRADAGAPRH